MVVRAYTSDKRPWKIGKRKIVELSSPLPSVVLVTATVAAPGWSPSLLSVHIALAVSSRANGP